MSPPSNNAGLVAAAFLFLCATSFMILSNFLFYVMIGQINVKLPEEQRIGYFWFDFGKNARVFREYRRLYPSGYLHVFAAFFFAVAIALLLAFAWEFGFFDFGNLQR